MKNFNVGIQLWGLHQSTEKDLVGTLRALKEMGYDYVELAGYYGKSAEELRKILDGCGLLAISAHQMPDFYEEKPQEAIDFLAALGVKYPVIPWCEPEKIVNAGVAFEEKVKLYRTLGQKMRENGMMLGYHNHEFEFEKINGEYVIDRILSSVGLDLMFPEFDTGWVRYAGVDPAEKLKEYSGKMPLVHLKDFTLVAGMEGPKLCPVGYGIQDMKALIEACDACGIETLIVEQDDVHDGMTELEAARLSREYLKNTFGI